MVLWCSDCGFGWQHPLPTPAEIRYYYDNSPTYNLHDAGEKTVGFHRRIQRINHFALTPGRLLDVGSGLGDFLDMATRNGWEAVGIEPQESAAQVCHQRFGIRPQVCVFEDISLNLELFDVVTIWDVWEHVHTPLEFIDRCISLLAPGGLLALSIPNASGYPARLFKGRWRYVMFTHLNYFKISYIESIMSQRGMIKLWADHTMKAQSTLQGIEGFLPVSLKTEKIIRLGQKTDTAAHRGKAGREPNHPKKMANAAALLSGIRRLVHKANLYPLPISKGDMMDLYFKKTT
jgi:2-polyprenyl-3-methyl-5-hydroxy-6-metoxy-1,4-benzoquinol methylase